MNVDLIRVIYPSIAFAIALASWVTLAVLVRLRSDIPTEKPIARMLLRLFALLVFAFAVAESVLVISTLVLVVDPDPAHTLAFRLVMGFGTQLLILVVVVYAMWTLVHQNPARKKP